MNDWPYLGLIIVFLVSLVCIWDYFDKSEGKEKAALIYYLNGMEIPPEQARHVNIQMNLTNVELSIEQFTVLGAE